MMRIGNLLMKAAGAIVAEAKYTVVRFVSRTTKEEMVEKIRQLIQDFIFSMLVKSVQKYIFVPSMTYIMEQAEKRNEEPKYFFSDRCLYTES
jgi:hypothetical protein